MFLINTYVAPSRIHGNGVFAAEPVLNGQLIWRFQPPFDLVFDDSQLGDIPIAIKSYLDVYSYRSLDLSGKTVLSGDNARFLNHSSDPNTRERQFESVASRAIAAGEEITCDYESFCSTEGGFPATDWLTDDHSSASNADQPGALQFRMPHDDVYTRLRAGANGIGVFAIQNIPRGTVLFAHDRGETTNVPIQQIELLADEDVKQMYFDFCPLIDGTFVAPRSFDEITMGWYLNHSDEPNVSGDKNLRFVACRDIAKGQELRADYRAYSEHAAGFVTAWKKAKHF